MSPFFKVSNFVTYNSFQNLKDKALKLIQAKMTKNKNINLPEAKIRTSKVTKLGKIMGLQDQNLRMRHPLIQVHARVQSKANTNGFKWPLKPFVYNFCSFRE